MSRSGSTWVWQYQYYWKMSTWKCCRQISIIMCSSNRVRINKEREDIVTELVSGIGSQPLRFSAQFAIGNSGICRCLVGITRCLTVTPQVTIRLQRRKGGETGMIKMLLKVVSYHSFLVCWIALESLNTLVTPSSALSVRLLTVL